ncbi:Syntaxin-124 [Striga hermonthica]|uniref:Syntaxin-124 n=1 Tax=Striga hermonthica TaxID=68872 RepID=A0A9N7RLJ6_STRHE|nr:Syntaxin-124 [Striga hermonthica]
MDRGAFDGSFKIYVEDPRKPGPDIETGRMGPGPYGMEMFAKEVDNVKEDMKSMDKLYGQVHESNEDIKVAQNAAAMRELRDEVNTDLDHVIKLAKQINKKYDGLVRANAAQRRVAGSGPGSSDDNTRAKMISELGDNIKQTMRRFQGLRVQMETDHRQLIESSLLLNSVVSVGELATLAAEGQAKAPGPPSPVEPAAYSPGVGPPGGPPKAGGPAGLNDYERETRNQAYIAIAVALVIIISVIVSLLKVENQLENDGTS